MKAGPDLLGAVAAHVIYVASILTFAARLLNRPGWGRWFGAPILLMAVPLVYLLVRAGEAEHPVLYTVQIGAMLLWITALFLLDYVFHFDFRHTQWMVIAFVMLFFAGTGGMIGVAAQAGKGWTISAVVLFLIAGVLAFVQRAVTGM